MDSQDAFDATDGLFQALLDLGVGIVVACRGNASQFARPCASIIRPRASFIDCFPSSLTHQAAFGKHLRGTESALVAI
jgi:hypothetical protein